MEHIRQFLSAARLLIGCICYVKLPAFVRPWCCDMPLVCGIAYAIDKFDPAPGVDEGQALAFPAGLTLSVARPWE